MLWLPCGSRFPRAHGRGVARLTNPVGGHLLWVEVRTNQTHGYKPFFLPVSNPNPTAGSTSAKSFVDIKGYKVAHDVIARPRQFMGHRLTRDHQMAFGLFALVKPLHRRAEADSGHVADLHFTPVCAMLLTASEGEHYGTHTRAVSPLSQ